MPGGKSPVNQIMGAYYDLKGWLEQHGANYLGSQRAATADFKNIYKIIVIVPALHPKSDVQEAEKQLYPPFGKIIGLDKLPQYLHQISIPGTLFNDDEIIKLAQELGLSSSIPEVPEEPQEEAEPPPPPKPRKKLLWWLISGVYGGRSDRCSGDLRRFTLVSKLKPFTATCGIPPESSTLNANVPRCRLLRY